MPGEERKRVVPFWAKGAIAGSILFVFLVAGWTCLPRIAAFGLRYDATRDMSKKMLKWLGPRATREIFRNASGHYGCVEWWKLVEDICLRAEEDARTRRLLVSSLGDPNTLTTGGCAALHFAAYLGCTNLAESLLDSGADPNIGTGSYGSAMQEAARQDQVHIAELLFARGGRIDTAASDGRTPLHIAAAEGHTRMVEWLIAKGADTRAQDRNGGTPLHEAAEHGCVQAAALLIVSGAHVNDVDNSGSTPLHSVPDGCVAELFLARGANIGIRNREGKTVLDVALEEGREDIVKLLRNHLMRGEGIEAEE